MRPTLNIELLTKVQRAQLKHDQDYHPDILALNTIDRLKHMVLHNTKYAARFIDAEDRNDDFLFESTLVDAFVIGVATSNTLVQNLSVILGACENDDEPGNLNQLQFSRRYIASIGKMAKACESIDHLEKYPFREVLQVENASIIREVIIEAEKRGIDLLYKYEARISDVEKKSPFRIFHEA